MVTNLVLVLATVWGFPLGSGPVYAADEKPVETIKAVLYWTGNIDAAEAVTLCEKLGHTGVVRLPLLNAIVVWGTPDELLMVLRQITPL